jgi:hypothetical protein
MFRNLVLLGLMASTCSAAEYDVGIYGGTSAGIASAIQTARMGKSVVLIEPSQHLGGLTSGGLGFTDSGNKAAVGGISREFYQRIKKYYEQPEAWKFEKRDANKSFRAGEDAMWTFEPKVAEKIYRDMLAEHKIVPVMGERLDRTKNGIVLDGKRIVSIKMESGKSYQAKVWIDATYEGDLMALAGVTYTVGREANRTYGETLNGVAKKLNKHNHLFVKPVDPYVTPGDPKSGLLFGIEEKPLPEDGEADHRLQAYCFRMCMSNVKENSVPFEKPANYDEKMFELLFRNFEAGDLRFPMKPDMMPNGKTDTNNNCAFSTDFIGQNYKFADADYAERDKIIAAHLSYQQGLMWSLANHPRVPKQIRDQMAKWGMAKDEFTDSNHWPHQIYVREARRLVGQYVATEHDCRRTRVTPESVGMGSYNMDSHNCARYVTAAGKVQNEGDVQESPGGAYQISYQSLIPKVGECPNLLVPVCLSSSHIAYGSIRMEPVFMVLGQSAATAAVLSIDDKLDVQKVPYAKLKDLLVRDKQVLDLPVTPRAGGLDPKKINGIVIDDSEAIRQGFEPTSSVVGPFVGSGYRHDGGINRGSQSAVYTPKIPAAGKYEVRLSYTPNGNRATNVPVTITHQGGSTTVKVNQRQIPKIDKTWVSLGTFTFEAGNYGKVEISNKDVDGFVVIDAVQLLKVKE